MRKFIYPPLHWDNRIVHLRLRDCVTVIRFRHQAAIGVPHENRWQASGAVHFAHEFNVLTSRCKTHAACSQSDLALLVEIATDDAISTPIVLDNALEWGEVSELLTFG